MAAAGLGCYYEGALGDWLVLDAALLTNQNATRTHA